MKRKQISQWSVLFGLTLVVTGCEFGEEEGIISHASREVHSPADGMLTMSFDGTTAAVLDATAYRGVTKSRLQRIKFISPETGLAEGSIGVDYLNENHWADHGVVSALANRPGRDDRYRKSFLLLHRNGAIRQLNYSPPQGATSPNGPQPARVGVSAAAWDAEETQGVFPRTYDDLSVSTWRNGDLGFFLTARELVPQPNGTLVGLPILLRWNGHNYGDNVIVNLVPHLGTGQRARVSWDRMTDEVVVMGEDRVLVFDPDTMQLLRSHDVPIQPQSYLCDVASCGGQIVLGERHTNGTPHRLLLLNSRSGRLEDSRPVHFVQAVATQKSSGAGRPPVSAWYSGENLERTFRLSRLPIVR